MSPQTYIDEYKRPIILVVEDEEDMRQNLKELLGDRYKILTAANGEEAPRLMTCLPVSGS